MHFISFYVLISLIVLIVHIELASMILRPSKQTAKCPPLNLRNGYYKGRTDRRRFMRFDCYPGYYLAGQRYLYCKKGLWDGVPPKCVKPTCSAVRNITNGGYFANPAYRGAVIIYFCNPEYKLLGEATTYCDGRIWENPVPTCIKNGENPPTECDFETDLCGWAHDLNHDFDWRRQNKSTPSGHVGTGPQFDHTFGAGQEGNYMYIESTSRLENDTARLFSPLYQPNSNFGCFEFFYHMYGATIGTLNVYVRSESQNFYLNPVRPNFSKSGNQGDKWYRGNVVLGTYKEPFQIIIEGIRGSGYVSDIAIDDIKLRPNCIQEETTTVSGEEDSSSPFPVTDSFDAKQSCDGRCFLPTNDSSCTCYEDCILDNNCCLDFIEVCILSSIGNIDGITNTEGVRTTEEILFPNNTNFPIKTTIIPTTERPETLPTTKTTTTTIKPTTLSTILPNTTLIKTTSIPTTKTPIPTTKKPTSTTKKPTLSTKKSTPTPKATIPTTKKPTISTTIYKKSTNFKYTEPKIEPYPTDEPFMASTQLVIASSKVEEKNSFVLPITGIALTVLLVATLLVMSLKKLRNHRKLHSRNQSESTTDVRYISSNEIIDFTLASPQNDDESDRLL